MSILATRRLIDEATSLEPSERALLDLWLYRGLDDPALARMTGITTDAIATRRVRIIEQLSDELGLPIDQIRDALVEIAASSTTALETQVAASANGLTDPADAQGGEPPNGRPLDAAEGAGARVVDAESDPNANGHLPATTPDAITTPTDADPPTDASTTTTDAATTPDADTPDADTPAADTTADADPTPTEAENAVAAEGLGTAAAEAPARPPSSPPSPLARGESEPAPKRRRVLWAALGALIIVAVFVLAFGSSSTKHSKATVSAPTPTSSVPASTSPTPTVGHSSRQALAPLPGGLAHTSGSVVTVGQGANLRLKLSFTGLPAVHGGHYELWLYNSIIDSQPLASLRAGSDHLTIKLPPGAHGYRWIDISFQPLGDVNHSGESVLRAANPAAAR